MLVNLRDVCSIAEQNNMAIAAVNSASLEAIRAAIEVAEETGYPIIIQHAEGHEGLIPLKYVSPIVTSLAERSSAQICLNLDHCEHLSYAQRALAEGFTGVMFDGSALPYEQNVEYSQRVSDMCVEYGAGLEQARDFVERTGLDILACSFGTVHGIYKGEPHLNYDVLRQIRQEVGNVPLVMHGGSGVSDDDYHKAIDAGIRKINYYTYGVKYAGEAVCGVVDEKRAQKSDAIVYWHDLTPVAYESFRDTFEHVVRVFANGADPVA